MILRARQQRQRKLEADLLTAPDAAAARTIVYAHLKPIVRRDGRMIYRVADGGVVMNEAQHVRVSQLTAGAAYLALTLAADRFENCPLVVNGTEDFRRQVATLAAVGGLRVRFAAAALEQQHLVARARHRGGRSSGARRPSYTITGDVTQSRPGRWASHITIFVGFSASNSMRFGSLSPHVGRHETDPADDIKTAPLAKEGKMERNGSLSLASTAGKRGCRRRRTWPATPDRVYGAFR
jgi:hypothetical protein